MTAKSATTIAKTSHVRVGEAFLLGVAVPSAVSMIVRSRGVPASGNGTSTTNEAPAQQCDVFATFAIFAFQQCDAAMLCSLRAMAVQPVEALTRSAAAGGWSARRAHPAADDRSRRTSATGWRPHRGGRRRRPCRGSVRGRDGGLARAFRRPRWSGRRG